MSNDEQLRALRDQVDRVERRFYGKYRGLVVDDADPQKRGRLRVLVPEVLGDMVSGWAEGCFSFGAPEATRYAAPPATNGTDGRPTTVVWIEFQGGDPGLPIWVGVSHPIADATGAMRALRGAEVDREDD